MSDTPAAELPGFRWRRLWIDDRPAVYGVAGEGIPVVFLHGWGLGHHAYRRTLERIVPLGARVYAPALPGFGGTAELSRDRFSIAGYARWVDAFLRELEVDEPVVLMGHSFGGGVAVKTAHSFPERVRSLALINAVGGAAWREGRGGLRTLAERPLWDWGLHFPSDILPLGQITRVLPVILEDAVPNLLRNPRAVWRVARLARRANLTRELEELKDRGVPVVVLWGADDRIIPEASFEAMCRAIGTTGTVVEGNHSWLLADPDSFGEVITNVVEVAQLARDLEQEERAAAKRRRGVFGIHRTQPRELPELSDARPEDERAG